MKKTGTLSSFLRLMGQLGEQRRWFILGMVMMVARMVTSLMGAHLLRGLTDAVVGGLAAVYGSLAVKFILIALLGVLLLFLERFLITRFAETSSALLRERLVEKISRLPFSYLDKRHSGDLVSRATNDLNVVRMFLFDQLAPLLVMPLMGIGAFIYILTVSWRLTLLATALVPLMGLVLSKLSAPMRTASGQLQEALGETNSQVQDALDGAEVVKAFNLEEKQDSRLARKVQKTIDSGLRLARHQGVLMGVSTIGGVAPFFITFAYGGYLTARGVITVGGLMAFINLLNNVTNPLHMLPHLIGQAHTSMAAFDRLDEIFAAIPEREEGAEFPSEGGQVISLEGVRFAYDEEEVLQGVSFSVNRGETVALVGTSGGGKSTILKLIAGFYEPQAGELRVFGHSTEEWKPSALRKHLALVSQDTFLFPGTVRENIAYGREGASEEEIIAAARLANADDFIRCLPEGYDTIVGERGSRLSGGQKQRIAIARAALKDSPILLLDEPTSALDTESEALVQNALEEFMKGRTTVVVAHRLSTIKNADRVVVIAGGRVIEEGTHDELLSRRGAYHNLYQKQFADDNKERAS